VAAHSTKEVAMRPATRFALLLLAWGICSECTFAHDYYPLGMNNEWFYRSVGLPLVDSTISTSVRVVGDTLLPNGHHYSILNHADIMGGKYVRSDSTSVYYLNPYTGQEELLFKLNGIPDDTIHISWGPYGVVRISRVDTMSILGESLRAITFEIHGLQYAVMRLCDKFGPMTEWRYSDPPPPWPDGGRELVGCTINGMKYGITLGVAALASFPVSISLSQNYPNPFNPETRISFFLPSRQSVTLRIIDITGREVRTLVHGLESEGSKTLIWDGRDNNSRQVSSGAYIYELSTHNARLSKRLLLLR
jgi:hypothetical protein